MNAAHQDMDDMAEHAVARQVIDQRARRIYGTDMRSDEGYTRVCTGPCDQGDKECPHPMACQLPERAAHRVSGAISVPFWCFIGALFTVLAGWHFSDYLAGCSVLEDLCNRYPRASVAVALLFFLAVLVVGGLIDGVPQ